MGWGFLSRFSPRKQPLRDKLSRLRNQSIAGRFGFQGYSRPLSLMKARLCLVASMVLIVSLITPALTRGTPSEETHPHGLEVGPFCTAYPYGMTILVDRGAAFVINPEADAFPDSRFSHNDEALAPYPGR